MSIALRLHADQLAKDSAFQDRLGARHLFSGAVRHDEKLVGFNGGLVAITLSFGMPLL